jgi:DNA primase
MGTALTSDHARILSRYTKELVLCYDNDEAGKKSTDRVLGILKDADLSVRVLQLPNAYDAEGKPLKQDPDDFVKKFGPAAFEKCLNGSAGQNDYRIDTLLQGADLSTDEGRMNFLRSAVETVGALGSPIEREIYGNKAAAAAGISGTAFAQEVERWRKARAGKARKQEQRQSLTPTRNLQPRSRELRYDDVRSARAEEGVLRLVLLDPALFAKAGVEPEQFSSPTLGKAFQLLRDRHERGLAVQLPALAGELTGDEMSHLVEIQNQPESLANGSRAMADYIQIIKSQARQRQAPKSGDALLELRDRQRKTMEEET